MIEERRRYNQNLASIIGEMGGMIDLVKMTALHRTAAVDSTKQLGSVQRQLRKVYSATRVVGASSESVRRCQSVGIRATLGNQSLSDQWSKEEAGLHSNNREMLASLRAVEHF